MVSTGTIPTGKPLLILTGSVQTEPFKSVRSARARRLHENTGREEESRGEL